MDMNFFVGTVFIVIAAFFAGMALTAWSVAGLKEENERLNQKLQRNNPRDERGRFTKDK